MKVFLFALFSMFMTFFNYCLLMITTAFIIKFGSMNGINMIIHGILISFFLFIDILIMSAMVCHVMIVESKNKGE